MLNVSAVRDAFATRFGTHPRLIVRAPGRVNLIGEHTDYNEGFVLPVAIDRATYVAARNRDDNSVVVVADTIGREDSFLLSEITFNQQQRWSNYVRGVAKALLARDPQLAGANMLVAGDVPMGSGLSSSASLEVAVGYAFQLLNGLNLLGEELALLAQGAENTFVGVRVGIMDQFIAALGQADHALLIDCRDLSYRAVPLPHDVSVVVCGSGIHHQLSATGGYNERRAQCEEAVRLLKRHVPSISALRDVTPADLDRYGADLPEVVLRRARHVVSENARVLASVAALDSGDIERFGALMAESHRSMRDDYEISVPEIDTLVDLARKQPGCYGARLTGGGFGGSTVNLVAPDAVASFEREVGLAYTEATGITPQIYVCRASDGVGRAV
ncbi:MAG: galactokinase [Chloroflexales bacterium]|nr:galactokinase [Chloroflexales bacterium]